jgi:hypothetical protein
LSEVANSHRDLEILLPVDGHHRCYPKGRGEVIQRIKRVFSAESHGGLGKVEIASNWSAVEKIAPITRDVDRR